MENLLTKEFLESKLAYYDIEYTDNTNDKIYFARELTGLYLRNFLFLDKNKKKIMKYSSNYRGKPSNIIKIIPEFIKSL